jgi:hypothetical protein
MGSQKKANSRLNSNVVKERAGEIDKRRSLTAPILRIVTSFTSLVDSADFLEVSQFLEVPYFLHRTCILSWELGIWAVRPRPMEPTLGQMNSAVGTVAAD